MGLFSRFEDKAEDVIEYSGRNGIEPVRLAKRAAKEMEREKMVGVGHEYAPTLYNILVSSEDDERMSGYYPSLAGEIETHLMGVAERNDLIFDCPPLVRFIVDEGLKRGKFDIIAESVSPAIIDELRHEELVYYGIEPDDSGHDEFDNDGGYGDSGYGNEPQDYAEPAYASAPYEDEFVQEQPVARQNAERKYPPTQAPIAKPAAGAEAGAAAGAAADADQTIMLGAQAQPRQPDAILYNLQTHTSSNVFSPRATLGRETNCDIVVSDPSVSRHHAELLHNEGGWLIRDTGSTNGMSVNGTQTAQSRIYDGDIIELGKTRLEFQEG